MGELGPLIMQIAMGIGLAACAGLRLFLPLFVVSVAGLTEWLPLDERFAWMGTWPAVTVFGIAVVVELLADKIPWVDNALSATQGWLKPVAGAMLAVAMLSELTPLQATVLGVIAGGSTAGVVHLLQTTTRLISSTLTGGLANPVLSVGEDVLALTGSVLALVVPLALLLMISLSAIAVWIGLRRFRTRTAGDPPAGV